MFKKILKKTRKEATAIKRWQQYFGRGRGSGPEKKHYRGVNKGVMAKGGCRVPPGACRSGRGERSRADGSLELAGLNSERLHLNPIYVLNFSPQKEISVSKETGPLRGARNAAEVLKR